MSTMPHEQIEHPTDDWIPRHRLTVDEYYRMAEVGLLAPDAQVELIQGEVIDMVPIGSRHGAIVRALEKFLYNAVGDHAIVSAQSAVRLDDYSEPQPDVALLKPRADFYFDTHPGPPDILLLIEVSNSTPRYDRQIKVPLYARHAIPEVWLIDVQSKQLHRLRQPANGTYQQDETFTGGALELPTQPPAHLDLAAILGLIP